MKEWLKYWRFLIVLAFLGLSLLLMEQTKTRTPKENAPLMLAAAEKTEAAFSAIRTEKLVRGYPVSPLDDPNATGLIGEPYTEITTTLGSLESKRSTTNPNVAAMIVDMLLQCGVGKGDKVAVNLSSSFPCLNLAVLCALDTLEARGVIINSVGASTYGANLPEFTYLDMEQLLLDQGLISNHSLYFSMGGAGDLGKEMPEEVKSAICSRLEARGLSLLHFEDLTENLAHRSQLYEEGGLPVCFINAGGNLLSFGGGTEMVSAHNGILSPEAYRPKGGENGLIPHYLQQGVPVIHLLNMKTLLPAYGLPYDPSPLPAVGDGGVYSTWQYQIPLGCCLALLSVLLLFWAARSYPHRKIPL